MDIKTLQYFLMVVREGSISRAANALHITQPTISRQMKELEEYLGKKLFIRGNKKITLTEEGILLKQRAEEIVGLTRKAETEIMMTDASDLSGDIHIGSGETNSISFITKIIQRVHEKYPRITFHLYSGNANDVRDKLDKGILDFGILINSEDLDRYDCLSLPVEDKWGVLFHKESDLIDKETIQMKDLENQPLILPGQGNDINEMLQYFQFDSQKLNLVATYNLIYNASLMANDHLGYVLCLENLVNTNGTDLVFKLIKPEKKLSLTFVWKKYQFLNRAAQYFLQEVQNSL